MTPEKLIKRQKFVKGKPLKNRAMTAGTIRRDENHVIVNTEVNDEYDTFFDFEEDLSDFLPSNEQAASANASNEPNEPNEANEPFVRLEPEVSPETPVVTVGEPSSSVTMDVEPLDHISSETHVVMEQEEVAKNKPKYMDVKGFKFSQCSYIKRDGDRCRRQAPKGRDICSIHKRMAKAKNK